MKRDGFWGMISALMMCILLLLFGATGYTLVAVGSNGYSRILARRDENNNARVAISYLTMRLRQNDAATMVELVAYEKGKYGLALMERVDMEMYETRIYLYEGLLYESFVKSETRFHPLNGFVIGHLSRWELSIEETEEGKRMLHIKAWGKDDEDAIPRETSIWLRTGL